MYLCIYIYIAHSLAHRLSLASSLFTSKAFLACECNPSHTGPNTACEQCAAATFKATAGPAACSMCHTFATSALGSTSAEDCVCNAGHSLENATCVLYDFHWCITCMRPYKYLTTNNGLQAKL